MRGLKEMKEKYSLVLREVCKQMSIFAEQKADVAHAINNIQEEKAALTLRDNLLNIEDKLIAEKPLIREEANQLLAAIVTMEKAVMEKIKTLKSLSDGLIEIGDAIISGLKSNEDPIDLGKFFPN